MVLDKNLLKKELVVARESGIHNFGVFAQSFIPKGSLVIEYVGEKISKKESEKRASLVLENSKNNRDLGAVYIFELNRKFDLDGNVDYNVAKFINHSCEPNCESELEDDRIFINALRDIQVGEEILYNYGYDISSFDEHPCFCGAENCKGYIASEDKWEKLKNALKKNFGKKKVLVVYYSRTGTTKKVANYLGNYFGFDVDEISCSDRKGIFGYVRSGYESSTGKKPEIFFKKNPADYDLVIVGTPVWAGTISSPVKTYLDSCKNTELVMFCTMGGKSSGKTFRDASVSVHSFKGLVSLQTKIVHNNKFQHKLLDFIRKIKL